MWGYQAEGAAPIVRGAIVEKPETIATAIRIGNPASWKEAEAARDQSNGRIESVTDEEILSAYRLIAGREGIFCEPSSAAGLAGLLKAKAAGRLPKDQKIVITVTGNGLKDVQWALEGSADPIVIPVSLAEAAKVLELS
jgi:threonine synthase